jgi:hypothetical protein
MICWMPSKSFFGVKTMGAELDNLPIKDPNKTGADQAHAIEAVYLKDGPTAAAELLRHDFLNISQGLPQQQVWNAEKATLVHDDPVNHAITHMAVNWAVNAEAANEYSSHRIRTDYWLADRLAGLDPFERLMAESANGQLSYRISRSGMKGVNKGFEAERKAAQPPISDWQPHLALDPNEVNDNVVNDLEIAYANHDSKHGKEILQQVGERGSTSLNQKLDALKNDGLPDIRVIDLGLPDPHSVELQIMNVWQNYGGRGRGEIPNSALFASAVVPSAAADK